MRPTDFNEFTKTPGYVEGHDAGPGLGIDFIWFNLNTQKPDGKPMTNQKKFAWFNNRGFRQAVAHAVDREAISNVTLQGLASPLYGFVSPANKVWINNDLPKLEYNLTRAAQMLEEAGFKKTGEVLSDAGGNPVEFSLIVPAENEPRKLMAASIQQDMAKLGIKMTIVPIENAAISGHWEKTFDYDAILFGLAQSDLEPTSYSNFLMSSSATHQWRPDQKTPASEWEGRIDTLFKQQAVERDQAKRLAQFHEIQKIMRDEMPIIPIAARHVVSAAHVRIGNFSPSSIMPYSLWNIDSVFVRQ